MMRLRSAIIPGILLPCVFAVAAFGQSITNIVDAFDPSGANGNSYAAGQINNVWVNWFGSAFQSAEWDPSADASSNPASGSLKITAVFDGTGSIPDQFEVYDGILGINPPVSGALYTNFQCDVRFAPTSPTVSDGSQLVYGYLQFGVHNGYAQDHFGGITVPVGVTNWVHVSLPINAATDPALTNITDVLIHIYGPAFGSPGLRGTTTLWVDNISFTGPAVPPANCVVNWTELHQNIDGFGASSAWTGSWTAAQADMFFSTNNGIGLSFLRNHIAPDGTTIETNIMQMAQARGARVWSAPWSPPAAFKDSGSVNGGNFVSTNYQAYANQLAGYAIKMKNNYGVNLYAISVQNEPDFNTTNYESCLWTAQQIHDFVPYLHTELMRSGLASTKVMIAESDHWDFSLAATAMNDPVVSNMVGVLAAHDYDYTFAPVANGATPLWETEVSSFGSYNPSIGDALSWAVQIHTFLTYVQANAWHFWWLAPYATDNESLTDPLGNPAKRMYMLGNFSRFVRPGYIRIGVSNNGATLASAYKDPNSARFAIVAINTLPAGIQQTFNLNGFAAASVTPWITSDSLSLAAQPAVPVASGAFSYTLPADSIVTFVGQANAGQQTFTAKLRNAKAALTIQGLPSWTYTIASSTNLHDWQTVLATNPPAMPISWTDSAPILNTRFYRLQSSP